LEQNQQILKNRFENFADFDGNYITIKPPMLIKGIDVYYLLSAFYILVFKRKVQVKKILYHYSF
jgi:hypothetical protein